MTVTGQTEAAEARAVGTEQDRHVAGEVEGADRVGVVVDVRRMQPRLAAVGARPARLGTDQADAGAGAVEVHLVAGGQQGRDVVLGEEVGRAVRAGEHAERPLARERGQNTTGIASTGGAAPSGRTRSTSPVRSTPMACPPKWPSAKVRRLPR
jgi:hypothetical protein